MNLLITYQTFLMGVLKNLNNVVLDHDLSYNNSNKYAIKKNSR